MIRKLLIANRGEIACRIIRTARQMGIECAVIYSDADSQAQHVQQADIAFHIGASPSSESYLHAHKIIALAKDWQADAIHPGYGFLSENSEFAELTKKAGIIFVGPDSQAIAAMGSKARAKELMSKAGVPLLPGYHGSDQAPELLHSEADKLGYPLLIKAVAGGGGRGLRVVERSEDFLTALSSVQREALAAFADQRVLLEKYLPLARHVEVQIFADQQGNCVHLFERDCSIQRRHQKLIEEAPAPNISDAVRSAMSTAAIQSAQAINYSGAGTVEFLYQDDAFYFMEMNTRLQVEHPVTEAITGLDLVEWQLKVAQGEPLPLLQKDIASNGCAIEARINAENPNKDFMPCSGLITSMQWPAAKDLRIDTGFRSGDRVSIYYDSLLAKMIVWAPTREMAIRKLTMALQASQITGIENNAAFLQSVLETSQFIQAKISTNFLRDNQDVLQLKMDIAAYREELAETLPDTWGSFDGWRNLHQNQYSRDFHILKKKIPGHDINALAADDASAQSALKAPLPGKLIALHVKEGDKLQRGDVILVLEAMKMEHTVTASADCIVQSVHCQPGDFLQPEQLLVEFSAARKISDDSSKSDHSNKETG